MSYGARLRFDMTYYSACQVCYLALFDVILKIYCSTLLLLLLLLLVTHTLKSFCSYSTTRLVVSTSCYHAVQNLLSSSFLSKNMKTMINRTIIVPVLLYGCETRSLTLEEKRRMRAFENRVLRRIFGPKREEVIGVWRKQYIEELNELYSSPKIVRVIH